MADFMFGGLPVRRETNARQSVSVGSRFDPEPNINFGCPLNRGAMPNEFIVLGAESPFEGIRRHQI